MIVLVAALVGLFGGLGLLARRARRLGVVGAALSGAPAAYDQARHASAFGAHLEIEAQTARVDTAKTPDRW